jgi:hypothetical protein
MLRIGKAVNFACLVLARFASPGEKIPIEICEAKGHDRIAGAAHVPPLAPSVIVDAKLKMAMVG